VHYLAVPNKAFKLTHKIVAPIAAMLLVPTELKCYVYGAS
jgi:hypothetical protein